MKIAIPTWNHYVSTVCDFSDRLLVVTVESGHTKDRIVLPFFERTILEKATRLQKLGIQVLLCGAVSKPLERMLVASGIRVIPFLRGTADEALEAYLRGYLSDPRFNLPGCSSGRWRRRGKGVRRRGRYGGRGNVSGGWKE
ncbi:MAG: NifB/NifX family molybdenum-iron cluster-binding protein [Deltaproteobacteria bacterium]|nr:NifB/NifX family molybdenum-iron cluster-binding protein [Deltaproteobacteria bacterium]